MRQLLEPVLLRQLRELETIHQMGQVRPDVLASRFRLSTKTLMKDFSDIEDIIAPIAVANNSRGLYTLEIPPEYSMDHIYMSFIRRSDRFALLELLFFHQNLTLTEAAERLYSSESTVKRMIASINAVIKPFGIFIETRPLRMAGDERDISNFYVLLFTEKHSIPAEAFPPEKQKATEHLVRYWFRENDIPLNFSDLNRLKIWLLVTLQVADGAPTAREITPAVTGARRDEFDDKEIKGEYRISFREALTEDRIWQAMNLIFPQGYVLSAEMLARSLREHPENVPVYESAKEVVRRVSEFLVLSDNDGAEDEELVRDLYNIFNMARTLRLPQYLLNEKRRLFFEMSAEQEKELYYYLEEIFEEIRIPNYHWKQSDFYEIFYILMTHWAALLPVMQDMMKKCRIGLFFDTDREHENYIRRQLEYRFTRRIEVEIVDVLSKEEFADRKFDYDLILTNVQDLLPSTGDVLCVQLMLTMRDWVFISRKVREAASQSINESP